MDANELTPEKNMEFNNEEGNANDVIEARPISFKNPDSNTIYTIENEKYYYHLKSDEMCRSLVEVHDFIKDGIPIRSLKKMKKKQDESPSKKKRGSSLLKKTVVGTYNFQTKMIYQLEAPAVIEENPQPPLDNLVHPGKETKLWWGKAEEVSIAGVMKWLKAIGSWAVLIGGLISFNVLRRKFQNWSAVENEENEMEENPMAEGETIIRQVNKSKDATSSAPDGGANVPYINFDFL
ncbi:hypothetical protein TEA_016199 [Camellia sinensis var. sinensis]|uniref:Uncharacterized protein n=1 Tax=Camellia sinensis var. sinensis TaxID=542762 RepID=A0A4S4E6C1_CAMSN|nr:hypothetical protein TEA_016199 [Camellia sinensis var. sinensis]